MRKVIGIGETVLDIVFRNDQPVGASPGGSVFNSMISLGRSGVKAMLVSEVGRDQVGENVLGFLRDNHVDGSCVNVCPDSKSPISLAFLDANNDAHYIFYNDTGHDRTDFMMPDIEKDDIILFGSYFALNPALRSQVFAIIEEARGKGAIIYYDVNFRPSHKKEQIQITPNLLENYEYADIVRGSADDFGILYNKTGAEVVYKTEISFYTKKFIFTNGGEAVHVFGDNGFDKEYPVMRTDAVSTIGAGDSFNAGFVYGMIKYGITREILERGLTEQQWDKLMTFAQMFAGESCKSLNNYVRPEFGELMERQLAEQPLPK